MAAGGSGRAGASGAFQRGLGLYGATMIGISAMLGAGIFVLSGVALRTAGPGAVLAFALGGLLAFVTAFSFAELASAFPESGGGYVFAKRVFPIGGAFAAGWVLWLAYVVAAALYALGFASFLRQAAVEVGLALPGWVDPPVAVGVLALAVALSLRGGASAGSGVTLAKVVAFAVLVVPGLALLAAQPLEQTVASVGPLLPNGFGAVLGALTFTFIALEGFEVIAAVGGEVRDPGRTIPRAMFLSIGITLSLYLGLLVVLLSLGGAGDGAPSWIDLGRQGEQAVRVGASRYLGAFGSWVVVVAGLLATYTAVSAALVAASRIAHSMARDRALPRALSRLKGPHRTPAVALATSLGLAAVVVLVTGEVELAGATASLVFLLSFALTNAAGLLVRVRGGAAAESFRAPLYPALPLVGITACLALAALQVQTAPLAVVVTVGWLLVGGGLYGAMFRNRAETLSARAEALDADLVRLRGREPLILVPLANPARSDVLLTLAHALAPPGWGRVLALSVARHDPSEPPEAGAAAYDRSQEAMRKAVLAACRLERHFEGVVMVEREVEPAIRRAIRERRPEVVVFGMSHLEAPDSTALLERVVAQAACDVVILNAPPEFAPHQVQRILVPVAGAGGHDPLRAQILGTFERAKAREVTLLQVLTDPARRAAAAERLAELADDLGGARCEVEVAQDPEQALLARAADSDLVVIGLNRRPGAPLFGHVVRAIAARAEVPLLMIARTG